MPLNSFSLITRGVAAAHPLPPGSILIAENPKKVSVFEKMGKPLLTIRRAMEW
jgi:hypothetical protein